MILGRKLRKEKGEWGACNRRSEEGKSEERLAIARDRLKGRENEGKNSSLTFGAEKGKGKYSVSATPVVTYTRSTSMVDDRGNGDSRNGF